MYIKKDMNIVKTLLIIIQLHGGETISTKASNKKRVPEIRDKIVATKGFSSFII